jgi:hypothetical protein
MLVEFYVCFTFFCLIAKNWSDPVGYPQIPVRALATGVFVNKLGFLKNFTHYYDYIDFRTSISDPTVFEVGPSFFVLQQLLFQVR